MIFNAACAVGIERPDTNLCIVNEPFSELECYNLRTDYTDEGRLKPGAAGTTVDITGLADLNKHICTDVNGFAAIKAYLRQLRLRMQSE